jgi:hypothetical protein
MQRLLTRSPVHIGQVPIDMLPDDALLEIFDHCMVDSDPTKPGPFHWIVETAVWQWLTLAPRVSKMAKYCFWITTSPQLATSLHSQHACVGDAGRLPRLAHCHR